MKRWFGLFSFLILFSIVPSANLFGQVNIGRGSIELSGSFSLISSSFSYPSYWGESESRTYHFQLTPSVGFFVTDNLEIEPQFLYERISEDGEGYSYSSSVYGGMLSLSYNFRIRSEAAMPFLFVGAGFLGYSGGDTYSAIAPDMGIGIKSFINKSSALRMEFFYQRMTNYSGWEDLEASSIGFRGGFSVFLK